MTYKEEFIKFMVDSGVLTFATSHSRVEEKLRISSTAETIKQANSLQSWAAFTLIA